MAQDVKTTAARAFVRSFNVLLKFARLYGMEHARCVAQLDIVCKELRAALPPGSESGLLLSASGSQLLLDGVPLDATPAERSFAQMLSSAEVSSLHFLPTVNTEEMARLASSFPAGAGKKVQGDALRKAFEGSNGIRVNTISYIPTDSSTANLAAAASITARALGMEGDQIQSLMDDPGKLISLISAAEGVRSGGGGTGGGAGGGGGGGEGFGVPGGGDAGTGTGGAAPEGGGGATIALPAPPAGTAASGRSAKPLSLTDLIRVAFASEAGAPGGASARAGAGAASRPSSGGEPGAGGAGAGGAPSGEGLAGGGRVGSSGGGGGVAGGASTEGAGTGSVFDLIDMGAGAGDAGAGAGEAPGRWETASSGLYAGMTSRPRRRVDFAEAERWGVGLGTLAEGEEDVSGMLGILRQFASFAKKPDEAPDPTVFQQRLSTVPLRVQRTMRDALNSLASQVTPDKPGERVMLELAEHMAIRFALKNFQGGGAARVSAVRELLERMGREIDELQKTVHGHEDLLAREGLPFRPYSEQLNEQFWENVPDETRAQVLKSKEAWCVSPHAIRQTVEAHLAQGDTDGAAGILTYYAQNIGNEEPAARRNTAMGLTELGDLFVNPADLLADTIRLTGGQAAREKDAEVRSLVSAAFVRLSTEAVSRRSYPGMTAALQALKPLQSRDRGMAESLLQRIAVQERIPELVEEVLSAKEAPPGLDDLLALLPRPAMECLAERFSQSGFREDCNLLLGLARKTGADGVSFLRETFRDSKAATAVDTVGLLGRLDPEALARYLPGRVREWPRSMHDRLVRYLAGSGASDRGRLILSILEDLDPLVRPMALDEVGLVGDDLCLPRLLELARGGIPAGSGPYLQVKAIEALGRARAPEAVALLHPLVEAKKMFRWVHPHEMRMAAAQALQKIDPQWALEALPRAGFSAEELAIGPADPDPHSACNRQRRYMRFRLHQSVAGVAVKEDARVDVVTLSLSGGAGACEQRFASGTLITLRLGGRLRPATLQAFVRTFRASVLGFEFAEMDLEERFRLRRLIVETGGVPLSDTPLNRSRVIRPRIKR